MGFVFQCEGIKKRKKVGEKYPLPQANDLTCVQNCGYEDDVTVQISEKSWLSYNSSGNDFGRKVLYV